jgi:hypothetical protein
MAFETKAWLADLGFTDAEITDLLPKFDARKAKVEAGQLRQSDYDRRMNEGKAALAQQQQAIADKDAQLNAEMAEWARLKQTDATAAAEQKTRVQQLETEKFQLEQSLKDLATQAGVDPATVLPTRTTPGPDPKPAPAAPALPFDPTQVVTFDKLGPIVSLLLNQSPEIYAITAEHQRLTGKPLPPEDLAAMVQEMPVRAGKKQPADLRAIWEEKYSISDLRRTTAEAAHTAELQAEYQRGQLDARTTASLPTAHAPGTVAPIFHHPEGQTAGSKAPGLSEARAAQSARVGRTQRAITALATGKYRDQATTSHG